MQQLIKANEHFRKDHGWLNTSHHFSFGEYRNPDKMNYGHLRVFNDDIVQPAQGFDFHPHEDMEIVTYVIDGTLEHKDNFGNHGIISAGGVQRMSAGSGVIHSEFNHSSEKSLRLLQMWFLTNENGLKPSWEDRQYTKKDRLNKLFPIITSEKSKENGIPKVHQDVEIFVSSLTPNNRLDYKLKPTRQAYVFVINGELTINRKKLETRDASMINDEKEITVKAEKPSELILIDVPIEFVHNQ